MKANQVGYAAVFPANGSILLVARLEIKSEMVETL